MGSCVWSKLEKIPQNHESSSDNSKMHRPSKMQNLINSKARQYNPDDSDDANGEEMTNENEEESVQYFFSDDLLRESAANKKIYGYVDQILPTVRSVILKNNEENPADIVKLQQIAKQESLWITIICRLIDKIEITDPLGPSIIAIFLEETPLPSKEQTLALIDKLAFGKVNYSAKIERNILVILSCLSEKVAGTSVASMLSEKTIDVIYEILNNAKSYDTQVKTSKKDLDKLNVILFALITLEKFAMSSQCKLTILQKMNQSQNSLDGLLNWMNDTNHLKCQIGFLVQYLLDNTFIPENHVFAYELLKDSKINVRLNDDDTSENLKISANGLEARNDRLSFESVRSTFQVDHGIWFYEVTLLTNGIMQIGFATKSSNFFNHQGFGIGDDLYSIAYDGCRRLIWHNAVNYTVKHVDSWKEGDIIGFLLDMDNQKICFYQNGKLITPIHTDFFRKVKKGIFPAASFMSFQHVIFNFGSKPFKYPPENVKFNNYNDHAHLPEDLKYVLPKRKKLEILRNIQVKDNACSLCCENASAVILVPCKHSNFCQECAKRLNTCPICRSPIHKLELVQ